VVWAGDVFHHKGPSRTPHSLVQQLISIGQSYRCPWFIVPGNHDIQHDRLDSIQDTQPLGVLYQAGAVRLEGWASDCGVTGVPLYGVPWQQHWTDEAVREAFREFTPRNDGSLVVTHAPLYPPGQELTFEYYPAEMFAEAMGPGSGYVAYGHVHEPHGVWQANGVTFCNNGALSRGSLHEYNLTRQVGVTLWDAETCEFSFVPLKAKPAEEVFRLREKAQVTDMVGRLDDFLAGISQTSLATVSVESVMERLRTTGADAGTLALAEELLAHGAAK
jgi:DNA repair exonuclease SbcCD nuclease subunit